MGQEETRRGVGGVLADLLAPVCRPRQVVEALESVSQAARELRAMRLELMRVRRQTEPVADLTRSAEGIREHAEAIPDLLAVSERIREQAEPVAELLSALEGLEHSLAGRVDTLRDGVQAVGDEEARLNTTVGELVGGLDAMHKTIHGLRDDIEKITDRLPDPGRGPLEKARDVLTAGGG